MLNAKICPLLLFYNYASIANWSKPTEEWEDELINTTCLCSIPGGVVGEQVKSAGSGIQFPLLWHVTLRVCSSVEVSFSQVNIKADPSRVEL